ncbi:VOC family protein [Nocardiopsis sp. CNT-189]|uniref:VOC family protein n=1 Tax=Nocardiopsis oceanisediminis TaxID=2816862 RepID=UPI003B39CCA9
MDDILPFPDGAELDHIVYAVPDLEAAARRFAQETGVEPAPGGAHPGRGTRNLLVGLGGRAYLEIIGPDPEQEDPGRPRPFGIDGLPGPGAVTWAVRTPDLDGAVRRARAAGHNPGEVLPMSRRMPGGALLEWRLTDPDAVRPGAVPFLIDWGASPHPADSGLPEVRPVAATLHHPDPGAAEGPLAALGLPVPVRPGPPGLSVAVEGPGGRLSLRPAAAGG